MTNNFQRDRFKYKENNQFDIYNPEFASSVNTISQKKKIQMINEIEDENSILNKSYYCASFFRWYPDLFLDMMSPPDSKKKLTLYQRVLIRVLFRFKKAYTTIPRGSAKSFIQLLTYLLIAVMYPNVKLSIIAETKEQSASIIKDKFAEITNEWYPFFNDEIKNTQFQRDIAVIEFQNGSRIDNLANAQTTKGQRRTRGGCDESARLNNAMFKDAVEPVFSLKRWSAGDEQDPYELNGQFHFFTTSGYRNTEEFIRTLNFVDDMANCKGSFVFGANWELPVHFGLLTKKFVMDIKEDETTSPIAFMQNYESIWVGAGEGALVNMDKVQALRYEDVHAELEPAGTYSYVIAMDVARSESQNRNQSAFVVFKLYRNNNGNVKSVDIVNIITPPNGLTFREQTIILKKLQRQYKAKVAVVDINGLGKGIMDECLHETANPDTGEVFDCWDSVNLDLRPDVPNSPKLLFGINASGINNDIIINFWDYIESAKVRFLVNERNVKVNYRLNENNKLSIVQAHIQTDKLMEELSNLKVEKTNNNKYTLKQITKKVDKDRVSALMYGLYYIQNFENVTLSGNMNYADYIFYN